MQTGFQWLELGSQVDSTTDHFYQLLIQHGEDLNTMRAEQAGVIKGNNYYSQLWVMWDTGSSFLVLVVVGLIGP